MARNLKEELAALTEKYVAEVTALMNSITLEELVQARIQSIPLLPPKSEPPTAHMAEEENAHEKALRDGWKAVPQSNGRRTPEEIEKAAKAIVALVKRHPDGILAEDIRKKLGWAREELMRPLQKAVEDRALKRKGERRQTTYFPNN